MAKFLIGIIGAVIATVLAGVLLTSLSDDGATTPRPTSVPPRELSVLEQLEGDYELTRWQKADRADAPQMDALSGSLSITADGGAN